VGAFVFVFAASQTFSELNFWLGNNIVVVDRPNCVDFIYRTEFERVKILFWQLQIFFIDFHQGPRRTTRHGKCLIGHYTSGRSLIPPLITRENDPFVG